jgi:phosphoserine phosphatase
MEWIAFAALLIAQPVAECAAERVAPADRQTIGQQLTDGVVPEQALFDRLAEKVSGCSDDESVTQQTMRGTLAHAARIYFRASLHDAGVNVDIIDHWFEAQPDAFKISQNLPAGASTGLTQALIAGGHSLRLLSANGKMLGGYLAALIMSERSRRGLSLGQ